MKLVHKKIPVTQTKYTIEFDEDEIKLLTWCLGMTSPCQRDAEFGFKFGDLGIVLYNKLKAIF